MKKKPDESAWEIDCGNLMSQFVQKYQGTVVTRGQFFAMQYRDENGPCVLRYAGRRGYVHSTYSVAVISGANYSQESSICTSWKMLSNMFSEVKIFTLRTEVLLHR